MATQPKHSMNVDEFMEKYQGAPAGRFELVDGEVLMMSPETALHGRVKGRIYAALSSAINGGNLPCEAFPDGMTVKIGQRTAREPDAAVQCGTMPDPAALWLHQPLIVFEVVSPSSERDDTGRKLVEYFSVSSIQHYGTVDPWKRIVVHHSREGGGRIQTNIMGSGDVQFSPPGFSVSVAQLLGDR